MKKKYRDCTLREMAQRLRISAGELSYIERGLRGCGIEIFRRMENSGYTNDFLKRFEITTVKLKADE